MGWYFPRLLSSFAEEQATEDAIYYLGEGLRKGVLDLDVFLKVLYAFISALLPVLVHKARLSILVIGRFLVTFKYCTHRNNRFLYRMKVSKRCSWKFQALPVYLI